MERTNYLICPGEACPIRLTCLRFMAWMDNEDDEADEMEPAYNPKKQNCDLFQAKGFYGG